MIGLQWTHVPWLLGGLNGFTLTCHDMMRWPLVNWVVFVLLLIFMSSVLSYCLYMYATIGLMTTYIYAFTGVIAVFIAITNYYKGKRNLHIHHYVIGYFAITFFVW
jgi:hypothetical protein